MASLNSPGFVATGNITPKRFVKLSASNSVALAGANEKVFGVSQRGVRNAPGTAADDTYAAIATESLQVYGPGHVAVVVVGSGGVTFGDYVKSDASGGAVAVSLAAVTLQHVAGIALETRAAGEDCQVFVHPVPTSPGAT